MWEKAKNPERSNAMKRLLLILVVLLTACTSSEAVIEGSMPNSIERHIDEEAGVVCWMYHSRGISCLPLDQTLLGDE